MLSPKKQWRVIIGTKDARVNARHYGNAVYLACRELKIQKPATDHNTGGFVGVSAEIVGR